MRLNFLYLLIAVLLLSGCNKTWEEEAGIRIIYKIPASSNSLPEYLSVDSMSMSLVACTFHSSRQQNSDVTKDIIFDKPVNLSGSAGDELLKLNTISIPQGTYYNPAINYLLSAETGLAVYGTFSKDSDTWPWVMTFGALEELNPDCINNNEWDAVAGRTNEIHLSVNPYMGLSDVDKELFEHANLTNVMGVPTIEINSKQNVVIFDLLKPAVEAATVLDFK